MKKILVVQITHDLNIGGLQRVVVDICNNINQERYNVSIVCLRDKGPFCHELEQAGVKVYLLPSQGNKVDYFKFWKLAKLLRILKPDIIHTHNTQPMVDGTIAGTLASVPVIVHTDHARDFPDKKRYMFAEWLMSHFVSRIVGVSDHTKQNLVKFEKINPKRITTVLNGIDGDKYNLKVDKDALKKEFEIPVDSIVLGTGVRLSAQKGLTYLIKAAPAVVQKFPRVRFLIAGDGPLRKDLEKEAEELGVAAYFRFLGHRLDIDRILQLFDLYILPSNWEGHPLVLLEAMAAHKPIVATDVGGVANTVTSGENGFLVQPQNPEALAAKIIQLLKNPSQMKDMGEKGYEIFTRHFTVSKMVHSYEKIYEECLKNVGA